VDVITPSPDRLQGACDWSSDGRVIVYAERDPKSGMDLWSVSPGGDRKPVPILRTRFQEDEARFSPDSRWIAYSSDESGRFEIYVQPFPGPGEKRRVSSAGGSSPCWGGDGKEIFYVTPGRDLMSVPMDGASGLPAGPPRLLFRVTSQVTGYDVSKDGERFLIARDAETSQPPIHVVVNWAAGIRDQ
jgi:Tol biopolymer transport system component